MAQLKDLIVNGPSRFIGDVYATTFTGNLAGNANTATALTGKTLVTASAVTTSNWSTYGNNHIPTMSFIAYWNGAHRDTYSNLTYCAQGTIIGSKNIGSQSVNFATSSGSCSGNAATATKLATSRTIWGQSFDGTGNVSGFPSFPACININRIAQTGAILDSSKIGVEIETYANDVRLKTYTASGGSNQTQLVLTSSGNVGIGTISPSAKLHVNGSLRASSLTLNGTNLLEWDSNNSAWKFNGNLIATGFIASGDISAQAAALAEEEDRISALEAQVAELQAEIATLKTQ